MGTPSESVEAQGTIINGVLEKTLAVEFEQTGNLLKRAAGSFVEDGFLVGMKLTTTDGTHADCGTILTVSALQMGVSATLTDVASASKTLTGKAKLGEPKTFDGPGGSATVIDVSNLDSTRKEKRMGLPDEGQFTMALNFVPGDVGQLFCQAARAARAKRGWEVLYPEGSKDEFEAFCLEFKKSGGTDAVLEANVTLEITGEVTFTPAA